MKKLGDLMMILDLHRQGVKIAAIARQVGIDRKTVRKYIGRGIEVPTYGPRQPRERLLDPYMDYLRARLEAYPGLSAQRLARELGERGYAGGYSTVRDVVRTLRPAGGGKPYAVRFETPAGQQAQVDFAQFRVRFADTPDQVQIVWLFSMVLGFSRLIWGRFVMRQTMPSVLACHRAAFEAIGGVPREILYDRMKTAVIGEDEDGRVVYNRTLGEFAKHYGFLPKACRAYRPETKGKVERPFRYIREDFFLGRSFRNMEDLNVQLIAWLDIVANVRVHGTTQRVVAEAFAEEQEELQRLPEHRFNAVLKLERRVSHDGLVAVGGNYYSVPDRTRRIVEVEQLPDLIRVIDRGIVVAEHPVLEGRRQYRIDRRHRTGRPTPRPHDRSMTLIGRIGDYVPLRSLAVYEAIGASLAVEGRS